MTIKHLICVLLLVFTTQLSSQNFDYSLGYFLPNGTYDNSISTPKEFLGHEVGQWHVTHDKLYYYMKHLSEQSDRIELTEYARSHENRPLIYLTITNQKNHSQIDQIKAEHKKLTNTALSKSVNIEDMPVIIYQGCSIHGNEPSGSNGALAMVYYLAAAQGDRIDQLLDEAVILFDPSYNPDGLHRFSTWANTHKGKNLISDPVSREFNEAWPGGRTNHYWFDLNRDWLLLTHPESRGRVNTFHEWKPDILTDHHEMGSNSTFYFQPGIPARTNPNTPQLNQDLTAKIGMFHGRALDEIGSLYYTKESFDDYYYGKGSSYPDGQGAIGILFEQASSRGHLQNTDHGLLSFPFTIRNQVTTMFSTQDAALALREELLNYKRQSFLDARELAKNNSVKGYVFNEHTDPYKTNRFIDILLRHQIEVHRLGQDFSNDGHNFKKDRDYVVSLNQDQYRLAKSIFEQVTTFEDSLFYDVSAWTLPLAFDIPYAELTSSNKGYIGAQISTVPSVKGQVVNAGSNTYAYLIEWNQYLVPRLLNQLHNQGIMTTLANESFESMTGNTKKTFPRGTLIIQRGNNQPSNADDLQNAMEKLAKENHLTIYGVNSGIVSRGVNLGSRSAHVLEDPKPLILIGRGVSSYDAGEVWHHFDQVLDMPVPMVDIANFSRVNLSNYRTLIMPNGSYSTLDRHKGKIKDWVSGGGTIIGIRGALNWLKNNDLFGLNHETGELNTDEQEMKAYAGQNEERGAKFTGGMIAQLKIDVTHPLFYGYHRDKLPVFRRGNDYYKPRGEFNTPGRYTDNPVMSGYLHKDNLNKMKGAAAVFTGKNGRGIVIGLADNPFHRGYWWGGSRLFANALFFSQTIN